MAACDLWVRRKMVQPVEASSAAITEDPWPEAEGEDDVSAESSVDTWRED